MQLADAFEMHVWPLVALPTLRSLDLSGAFVVDFTPLMDLPLEELNIGQPAVSFNLSVLRLMPTLKTINGKAAKEALK